MLSYHYLPYQIERERERERDRQRETERERQRERQTVRQTDRIPQSEIKREWEIPSETKARGRRKKDSKMDFCENMSERKHVKYCL